MGVYHPFIASPHLQRLPYCNTIARPGSLAPGMSPEQVFGLYTLLPSLYYVWCMVYQGVGWGSYIAQWACNSIAIGRAARRRLLDRWRRACDPSRYLWPLHVPCHHYTMYGVWHTKWGSVGGRILRNGRAIVLQSGLPMP